MNPRWIVAAAAAGLALVVGLVAGSLVAGTDQDHGEPEGPAPTVAPATSTDVDAAAGDDRSSVADESAMAAAVEYATASQDWLYLTDEEIEAEVRAIAAPGSSDRLVEETVGELGLARDGLMESAGRVWWLVRPLAAKEVSSTGSRAEVSVWVVTVLSASDVAVPQSDWSTLDLVLVRDEGRWLLESIDDEPGPTPISGVRDEPWQPEPFDDALDGFVRIGSEPA